MVNNSVYTTKELIALKDVQAYIDHAVRERLDFKHIMNALKIDIESYEHGRFNHCTTSGHAITAAIVAVVNSGEFNIIGGK